VHFFCPSLFLILFKTSILPVKAYRLRKISQKTGVSEPFSFTKQPQLRKNQYPYWINEKSGGKTN